MVSDEKCSYWNHCSPISNASFFSGCSRDLFLCLYFLAVWLWCGRTWISLSLSCLGLADLLGSVSLSVLASLGNVHILFFQNFFPLPEFWRHESDSVSWVPWDSAHVLKIYFSLIQIRSFLFFKIYLYEKQMQREIRSFLWICFQVPWLLFHPYSFFSHNFIMIISPVLIFPLDLFFKKYWFLLIWAAKR